MTITASRRSLTLLPLVIAVAVRFIYGGAPAFPIDDAYISLHAARHLFAATDPAFPDTPPLTGATSLLHVLALRLLMVVLAPPYALELLAWIGAAVYLWGCATMIEARVTDDRIRWACLLLAGIVGSTTYQLVSGLETGWALAAVIWSLHWLTTDQPSRKRLPLLAGALPWIRPDLALLSLAILVKRLRLLGDGLLAAAVCLPGVLLYLWETGTPIPQTMLAKRYVFGYYALPLSTAAVWMPIRLALWAPQVGPALAGLYWAVKHPTDRYVAAAFGVFLLAILATAPGVLTTNYYRYLYPLAVPLLIAGLATRAAPVLLVTAVAWSASILPARVEQWRLNERVTVTSQQTIADWLNANDPHATVLIHDAGYLSEASSVTLVDLVGLKSPQVVPYHARWTGPSAGTKMPKAMHAIACDTAPGYLVVYSVIDQQFEMVEGLQQFGWQTQALIHTTAAREPFTYTLYRLTRSPRCESDT